METKDIIWMLVAFGFCLIVGYCNGISESTKAYNTQISKGQAIYITDKEYRCKEQTK